MLTLESVMRTTPKTHIKLYMELTYEVAKLYQRCAEKFYGPSLREHGCTLYKLGKARDLVKRSKMAGEAAEEEHPRAENLEEFD